MKLTRSPFEKDALSKLETLGESIPSELWRF